MTAIAMKFSYYLIIFVWFVHSSAFAGQSSVELPSIVTSEWDKSEQLGQTKFSRFGIHIYDASLWVLSIGNTQASALSIKYARKISAERLLSSTKKQWKRLGFADQYPIDAWLQALEKYWPNVNNGDYLIFIASNNGGNSFYSKNRKLGSIDDQRFGTAFLDIWLSTKSNYQKQRKELLGENV